MTRRDALLLALQIPVGLSVAAYGDEREFWNSKPPIDWTNGEIRQLLDQSPWSKAATITNSAPTNGPLPGSRVGGGGGRHAVYSGGIGGGRNGGARSDPSSTTGGANPEPLKTVIRWESALPIREARRKTQWPDADEFYILALSGGLPSAGIPTNDDSPSERKQKLELLQDVTRIERRKDQDPLTLRRTEIGVDGPLFYFLRAFELKPDDKQVTFVTKIGSAEVKCKFLLKEMMYRGKLEL